MKKEETEDSDPSPEKPGGAMVDSLNQRVNVVLSEPAPPKMEP